MAVGKGRKRLEGDKKGGEKKKCNSRGKGREEKKKSDRKKHLLRIEPTTGHVLIWADKSAYCTEFDRFQLLSFPLASTFMIPSSLKSTFFCP